MSEVEIFEDGFQKKPSFGRKETFASDLIILKNKYKGTEHEPYMQFMLDSLIILQHARQQITINDAELTNFLGNIKNQ